MRAIMGRAWRVLLVAVLAGACSKSPVAPDPGPPPAPVSGTPAAIFLTPDNADLPAGGGEIEIRIATSASAFGGVPAPHVRVTLTASSGSLSTSEPQTDFTGHARVTWTGTSSATITAKAGEVEGVSQIRVAGTTPNPPPPNPGPNPGPAPTPTPGPPVPPKPPPPGRGPAGDLRATIAATPGNPDANQVVTFSVALSSVNGSAVPAVEQYVWDVSGDRLPDRFEASPTATYPAAGVYVVEVEIHTADNRAVNGFFSLPVGPVPTVTATLSASPANAQLDQPVTLTATATPTGNVGTLSYAWDFDGNATIDQTTAGNSTTTSYSSIGTKAPKVTVTGSRGGTATATGSVNVTAPALSIDNLTVSGSRTANSTLTFRAEVAAASGSVPPSMTFTWEYGNGSEVITGPSPMNVNHVYAVPGTYTVRVTVNAPDGRTATRSISVTITP